MDPISTIVAAVVAGASSGARDVASKGIADAYQALKEQLRRRFGRKSDVDRAVDEVERSPESGKEALQAALADASIEPDDELVALAKSLRKLHKRTLVENVDQVGDYVTVSDSPQDIHLRAEPDGPVVNERRSKTKAKIKNSGQSISIGSTPHPPENAQP